MEPNFTLRKQTSGAVNALSMSPDGNSVVVAGKDILKIYNIQDPEKISEINLRAGTQYGSNYTTNDIKWGNDATKSRIAIAATNGNIILWDLNISHRKPEQELIAHTRAVNSISFEPRSSNILISASHDETIKHWDFRTPKGILRTFYAKSGAVRDVQFNPVNSQEFAAVFDTGTLQKWDMRNDKQVCDFKVSAHSEPCYTIDWHPKGKLLASGGRDKTIKVWDMTEISGGPLYDIKAMTPLSRIQWRPNSETEIASCALSKDNRIHVWDYRRQNLAKYIFDAHTSKTTPTGFLWRSSNELLSVSKEDKWLIGQGIGSAYKPAETLKRNGMSWNVQGDMAFVVDKSSRELFVDDRMIVKPSAGLSKNYKRLGLKGALEEVVNQRSNHSAADANKQQANQYIPPQSSGIVHLPLFDFEAFSIFAEKYIISCENVAEACEINSELAWKMERYRTAETWKIIGIFYSDEPVETDAHVDMMEMEMEMEMEMDTDTEDNDDLDDTNQDFLMSQDDEGCEIYQSSDGDVESVNTGHSSFIQQPSSSFNLRLAWKHEPVVMELLEYYTNQGDVQMCVTLYLVLEKYLNIDNDRVEDWFNAYIELLHRFKLWSTATAIIKACKVQNVRERNENATTINIACNTCFKLVNGTARGSWACDKCHNLLNSCSICHETVRGLYVWCQGCNHGGHVVHMQDWFKKEKTCPTGCGHACDLQPQALEKDQKK